MQLLNRIVPIYYKYETEHGLPGVRARTWHPGWFIPILKIQIIYWLGFWQRYKNYQSAITFINVVLNGSKSTPDSKLRTIQSIIQNVGCDFLCEPTEPYGFVPEDGCPIHDI